MTRDIHDRIRERAHQIWEAAGCPHGADVAHWHQASAEIEAGGRQAIDDQVAGKCGLVPKSSSSSNTEANEPSLQRANFDEQTHESGQGA